MSDNEFQVETVKVVAPDHEGGFAIINKADLTPDHILFDEAKRKALAVKPVKASGKADDSED